MDAVGASDEIYLNASPSLGKPSPTISDFEKMIGGNPIHENEKGKKLLDKL